MSVISRKDLAQAEPEVARKVFRSGAYFKESTSGMCEGRVQTNLLGLNKTLAEDFAQFCSANSGPLPLLFKSDVGQFTAPGITLTDSDIRTDLPAYNIMKEGVVTDTVENLLEFSEALQESVFFYIGCSFSFDSTLLAAGVPLRNQEQSCAVSQFKTSVDCYPVGPFQCQLVASLRPIPRALVETAFKITQPLTDYHGAPMHIGDPALIGIMDLDKPEYCGSMKFHEGDVPVFWACGTSVIEAMKAVKPPLAFTHYEKDGVYISDTIVQSPNGPLADIKVVPLCETPFWASVTSEAIVEKIMQLEGFIDKSDLGNSVVPNDLLKAVLDLSHASSVAVTTGFPCLPNGKNLYEDYGLPGAIAITMMLQVLGKSVDLVVDKTLYEPLVTVVEALLERKVLTQAVSVVQYPPEGEQDTLETAKKFLLKTGTTAPRYDHLLAIERAGKAEDGGYYSMKGIDTECHVGGTDWLFRAAADMPTVHTSSIQDSINKFNMGKARDTVPGNIKQAPYTTGSVAINYLITAEVSNWGGYAVAVGLYLVSTCPVHERYRRRAVGFPPSDEDQQLFRSALPDVDRERKMFHILLSHKFFNMAGQDKPQSNGWSLEDSYAKIKQLLSVIGDE